MDIIVSQVGGRVPITLMQLRGEIDASNYQALIDTARDAYSAGARHLLLDLSELSFMASSGLVALHSIVVMRGEEPPDPEHGWGAFRAISRDKERTAELNCKLLSPQPSVARTLDLTGFSSIVQVYTDLETAIASF